MSNARKAASVSGYGVRMNEPVDQLSAEIARGLGRAGNITSVELLCEPGSGVRWDEADLVKRKY